MEQLYQKLDKMKQKAMEIIKEDNVAVEVKIKSGKDEICIKRKPQDPAELEQKKEIDEKRQKMVREIISRGISSKPLASASNPAKLKKSVKTPPNKTR